MPRRPLVTHALTITAALALGWWIGRPATPSPAPHPEEVQSAGPRTEPAAPLSGAALRAEIRAALEEERAAVRRELEAAGAAAGPAAEHPSAPPAPPPPTPAQRAAVDRVDTMVAAVLERGRLETDRSRELKMALLEVSPEVAHATRLRIAQAINRDELVLEQMSDLP